MMKISTKPMSSPSRTEKFPPLMRFLRSNVGSRSRGRSRSSPMFVRKKNAVIETQEPSSPKVTCIGQVRVRRSSKQPGDRSGSRSRNPDGWRCSCWWVRKTLFCSHFNPSLGPRSFRPVWRKWVWLFRFGCCRRADVREESSKLEPNRKVKHRASDTEVENDEDDNDDEEKKEASQVKVASPETFNSSQPPKNALFLTRSRSAPYRSSSLAGRFWSSPWTATAAETEDGNGENREPERPTSANDPNCRDSTSESRNRQEIKGSLGFYREFGGLINGKATEKGPQEELETGEGGSAQPLMLTRSKSEPARTGERLNPETSSWAHQKVRFCL